MSSLGQHIRYSHMSALMREPQHPTRRLPQLFWRSFVSSRSPRLSSVHREHSNGYSQSEIGSTSLSINVILGRQGEKEYREPLGVTQLKLRPRRSAPPAPPAPAPPAPVARHNAGVLPRRPVSRMQGDDQRLQAGDRRHPLADCRGHPQLGRSRLHHRITFSTAMRWG